MRITIRDAKPLFALSALLAPLDAFAFGQGLGWGLHFAWGRFVMTDVGIQILTPLRLFALRDQFGPGGRIALFLWLVAIALIVVATLITLFQRGGADLDPAYERQLTGALFVGAGVVFVVSRFFMYDFLLVGQRSDPNWFSVPIGALYVIGVGAIFYLDLFRLGAD